MEYANTRALLERFAREGDRVALKTQVKAWKFPLEDEAALAANQALAVLERNYQRELYVANLAAELEARNVSALREKVDAWPFDKNDPLKAKYAAAVAALAEEYARSCAGLEEAAAALNVSLLRARLRDWTFSPHDAACTAHKKAARALGQN